MGSIVRNVRSKVPTLVFYAGIIIVIELFFQDFSSLRPAAERIPKYTMYAILVLVGLHIILIIFPKLNPDFIDDNESELEEFAAETNTSELNGRRLLVELVWVIGYALGMIYVGFFTASFVFIYLYIFLKEKQVAGIRKYFVSLAWSIFINAFMYVLFYYLLRVSTVFELGFLL